MGQELGVISGQLFAIACGIGRTRKTMHDADFTRPARPVQVVSKFLLDYVAAIHNDEVVGARQRLVVLIGWTPPRASFVKLNTDRAVKDNRYAGLVE
jgi:hypothetical protein